MFCPLYNAGGLPGWSDDRKICPSIYYDENYDVDGALPPVVHKPDNVVFPLCVVREKELEKVAKRASPVMTGAEGFVRCSRITWYPKGTNGNTQRKAQNQTSHRTRRSTQDSTESWEWDWKATN